MYKFIKSSKDSHKIESYVTMDQKLVLRGMCRFRKCIPNNLVQCGIKIVTKCDAEKNYMVNAIS